MKTLRVFILAIFLAVFLSADSIYGRQKQSADEPTGLALEVIFYKDAPPAYQSVPPPDSNFKGAWFARFRRVANYQQPQGSLPVRAVNIVSRKEDDAVRVNLSVFVGVKFHDKEEQVATYLIRENEKVITNELTGFGVEPFEIAAVRVPQSISNTPSVINRTESIVIEGIEENKSTLPSYKLSLRNASSKHVVALQIDVLVDGKARLLSQPTGKEGQPLIKAGGDLLTVVSGVEEAVLVRHGYAPDSPRGQEILIGTAVFDDGSYEGDAQIAAHIRTRMAAQRVQLTQIVRILDNFKEPGEAKDTTALEALKQQVSALKDDVEMAVIEEIAKGFPQLNLAEKEALRPRFQSAMHYIKKGLLDEIDQFDKVQKAFPDRNDFRTWLSAIKMRYKQWLSRF
jgi:hypothetical protein